MGIDIAGYLGSTRCPGFSKTESVLLRLALSNFLKHLSLESLILFKPHVNSLMPISEWQLMTFVVLLWTVEPVKGMTKSAFLMSCSTELCRVDLTPLLLDKDCRVYQGTWQLYFYVKESNWMAQLCQPQSHASYFTNSDRAVLCRQCNMISFIYLSSIPLHLKADKVISDIESSTVPKNLQVSLFI